MEWGSGNPDGVWSGTCNRVLPGLVVIPPRKHPKICNRSGLGPGTPCDGTCAIAALAVTLGSPGGGGGRYSINDYNRY